MNKRLIKSINKANYIIANSNFTKKLAINVGINSEKIHVIFPGIPKPIVIEDEFKKKAKLIFNNSHPKL